MRQWSITKHLKRYDSSLFCMPMNGVLCVFRKSYGLETFVHDGETYHYSKLTPYYIFALTDNWRPQGTPVEWGIDVIMDRIAKIDSWNRDTMKELTDSYDKFDARRDRERKSQNEDLAREMRPELAKAFNDFNLSSVSKTSRRREYEKRKGKLTL